MLRLNVAIPPTPNPNPLGVLGGDVAGFPNGRRLVDDVVDIELRAVAGATPLTRTSTTASTRNWATASPATTSRSSPHSRSSPRRTPANVN
jgi:hypothetical protein